MPSRGSRAKKKNDCKASLLRRTFKGTNTTFLSSFFSISINSSAVVRRSSSAWNEGLVRACRDTKCLSDNKHTDQSICVCLYICRNYHSTMSAIGLVSNYGQGSRILRSSRCLKHTIRIRNSVMWVQDLTTGVEALSSGVHPLIRKNSGWAPICMWICIYLHMYTCVPVYVYT